MFRSILQKLGYPEVPLFARESIDNFNLNFDKLLLYFMYIQWFGAAFIAAIPYETYLYGLFGGALISLLLTLAYRHYKGTRTLRVLFAIGMMLFSLIYIQQFFGRIEMHFHVFIGLAIIAVYKDMVPIFAGAATTILHHLVYNYLQLNEVSLFGVPVMVFNYGCGLDIVFLHAFFVLLETIVLGYIIKRNILYAIEQSESEKKILGLNAVLQYASSHDDLTGLPNKHSLNEKLEFIITNSKRHSSKFALLLLDLDRFKNINDTLGHDYGDALLQAVSKRLKNTLRENDVIARVGGDEFVIVLSDITHNSDILECIEKIREIFKTDIIVKTQSLKTTTSIGCAIYPDDSTDIAELMKYADIAMYSAKAKGSNNFQLFTQKLNETLHKEVSLLHDMHLALERDEFELYYQPKVNTYTKEIIGAEALIRWNHPENGIIFPDKFIHLAESSGFILKLGKWIIHEAARFIEELNTLGIYDQNISINVSTVQAKNFELYKDLSDIFKLYNIRSSQLSIEITESLMMQSTENCAKLLLDIKALGIKIHIDDFGTGYSSLKYLKELPIDTLKIDKCFVDDIQKEGSNEHLLLNTIIAMGQTLDLDIIAEGVEEEYQLKHLLEKRCKYFQGYLVSRPVKKEVYLSMLRLS